MWLGLISSRHKVLRGFIPLFRIFHTCPKVWRTSEHKMKNLKPIPLFNIFCTPHHQFSNQIHLSTHLEHRIVWFCTILHYQGNRQIWRCMAEHFITMGSHQWDSTLNNISVYHIAEATPENCTRWKLFEWFILV